MRSVDLMVQVASTCRGRGGDAPLALPVGTGVSTGRLQQVVSPQRRHRSAGPAETARDQA